MSFWYLRHKMYWDYSGLRLQRPHHGEVLLALANGQPQKDGARGHGCKLFYSFFADSECFRYLELDNLKGHSNNV